MFTASQLLDKINTHVSELQFTRSPKGLYELGELFIPAKKAHSSNDNSDTDLLK